MLPIGTNIKLTTRPTANYVLIGINIVIFLLSYNPHLEVVRVPHPEYENLYYNQTVKQPLREWAQPFRFDPEDFRPAGLIGYQFLHANFMHILGNMYFLYFFGNAVNSKLGHKKYVIFYLIGGVIAGLGHALFSSSPVIGASGSVAAVTGAFLALFPKALVQVVYWFIFIGSIEIPAIWFIGLKLIFLDNILASQYYATNVAYDAHLAGYAAGILGILGMLHFKVIGRSDFDLYGMIDRKRRRLEYKKTASEYDPFTGNTADGKGTAFKGFKNVKDAEFEDEGNQEDNENESGSIDQLRLKISGEMTMGNRSRAGELYEKLIKRDPAQIMPLRCQLDLANQLMSDGKWETAADAYMKLVLHHPNYEHIEQIHLMLGILYSRYLDKPQQAKEYLNKSLEKLDDKKQIELCRAELEKL
jgi:membrane associated rhomboid family serine protease